MLFKEEPLLLTSKPNVHKPEQLRSLHRDKAVASKLQTAAKGLFLMRLLAPSARQTRPMSLPSPEARAVSLSSVVGVVREDVS